MLFRRMWLSTWRYRFGIVCGVERNFNTLFGSTRHLHISIRWFVSHSASLKTLDRHMLLRSICLTIMWPKACQWFDLGCAAALLKCLPVPKTERMSRNDEVSQINCFIAGLAANPKEKTPFTFNLLIWRLVKDRKMSKCEKCTRDEIRYTPPSPSLPLFF